MTRRQLSIVHSESSEGLGGQEHRVLAELSGFKARGHNVLLCALGHAEAVGRARQAGIPIKEMSFGRLLFPFMAVRAALWLRHKRVTVLNTHSSRDGWLMGVAGRLARVPLLIRSRHIEVDYPNAWISRHAYSTLADLVLTTSDKISCGLCEDLGLSKERVVTVPTGIDLEKFTPKGTQVSWADDLPVIGMVSVLRSWKGHRVFLEAARRLIDEGLGCRFVIVGGGPQKFNIRRWIEELDLPDHVEMTGHREDIPAVLRTLNVLVIPSTGHEGIPQIGLQALACGTPVVGSDAGGIPEIIRHGETGRIVVAGDAELLANTIGEALSDTKATSLMADSGRVMVEREHGIEHMLDQLERIYAGCLTNAGS